MISKRPYLPAATILNDEIVAAEDELNLKIEKYSDEARHLKKRISTENKLLARKEIEEDIMEQMNLETHEDVLETFQKRADLQNAVASFDRSLVDYHKQTENSAVFLEKISKEAQESIQQVSVATEVSEDQANEWLMNQKRRVELSYGAISSCLSATTQWLRLWPAIHIWLSNETICEQSLHQSAEMQGLIGELHVLNTYLSNAKIRGLPIESDDPKPIAEPSHVGVSIKPFSFQSSPDQPTGSDNVNSAAAKTDMIISHIKRLNSQVEYDNRHAKREMEKLIEEIKVLDETKQANIKTMKDLSSALSKDFDKSVRKVDRDSNLSTHLKDSSVEIKKKKSEKVKFSEIKTNNTPSEELSFTSPQILRKKKRKTKGDEIAGSQSSYNSHKDKYNTVDKKSLSAVSDWLLEFGWKRHLPYTEVTKPVNLSDESSRPISSRESATSTGKPHSVKSKVFDHGNREDALVRAKLALLETQSIFSRLGMATLSYCDVISGHLNLFSPTDQRRLADEVSGYLIDKNFGFYSQAAGLPGEGGNAEIVITMPKRREGRRTSVDILSEEGRLMTPVAEDAEEDEPLHEKTEEAQQERPDVMHASYRGENKKHLEMRKSELKKNKVHFAIQDMCNWIAHKEIASMLSSSCDAVHPTAPDYLCNRVSSVSKSVLFSKKLNKMFRDERRRMHEEKRIRLDEKKQRKIEKMSLNPHLYTHEDDARDGTDDIKNEQRKQMLIDLTREKMRNDRKNRLTAIGQKLMSTPRSPFKKHSEVSSVQDQLNENDMLVNGIVRPSEMYTLPYDDVSDSDHENDDSTADVPFLLVNEGSRKSHDRHTKVVKPLIVPVVILEEEDEEEDEEEKGESDSDSSESSLSPDVSDTDSNEEDTDYDSSLRRIRNNQRLLCDQALGDIELFQRSEIILSPVGASTDINVYYQVSRDRLCVDARCIYDRNQSKFRLYIYQKDLEQIFPTRPSLKLNDFSSNMSWRYLSAMIKLMRIDRMQRTDALSLALKLSHGDDLESTLSSDLKYMDFNNNNGANSTRMCSLLPDARQYRVNYAESLKASIEMNVDNQNSSLKTEEKKSKVPFNKAHTDNITTVSNVVVTDANLRDATVISAVAANRTSSLISNDKPDDSRRASVAIDVNFGQYVQALNHNDSDNVLGELSSGSSDLLWGGIIPIRPTSEKGSSRPVAGGRVIVTEGNSLVSDEKDIESKQTHYYDDSGHKKLVAAGDLAASDSTFLVQDSSVALVIKEASNKAAKLAQSPKKKVKGKNGIDPKYLPTAGDIARTMTEANKSPNKSGKKDFLSSHSAYSSLEKFKNGKSRNFSVNDLVVVFNIRQEGSEALLAIGAVDVSHNILNGEFL